MDGHRLRREYRPHDQVVPLQGDGGHRLPSFPRESRTAVAWMERGGVQVPTATHRFFLYLRGRPRIALRSIRATGRPWPLLAQAREPGDERGTGFAAGWGSGRVCAGFGPRSGPYAHRALAGAACPATGSGVTAPPPPWCGWPMLTRGPVQTPESIDIASTRSRPRVPQAAAVPHADDDQDGRDEPDERQRLHRSMPLPGAGRQRGPAAASVSPNAARIAGSIGAPAPSPGACDARKQTMAPSDDAPGDWCARRRPVPTRPVKVAQRRRCGIGLRRDATAQAVVASSWPRRG